MNMKKLAMLMIIVMIGVWNGRASAVSIYMNNFEGVVGSEWSNTSVDVTPIGERHFLGQFCNDTISLTLTDLPTHTNITVEFDLFIIRTWDGNDPSIGPDIWDLSVEGGETLLYTTFSNIPYLESRNQSYPDSYGSGSHTAHTGAAEINTLGIPNNGHGEGSSVYNLSFLFEHSESSLTLNFSASGLQFLDDESWGLDNVSITGGNPIPEPITSTIDVDPNTLNLKSKGVFTAFIDLPEGYDEEEIDISTVECEGAPAIKGTMTDDGRLIVKFDRKDLEGVPTGDAVELTVTGELNDGTSFTGSDTIRVIDKGK